jgi:hypothetical protein
VLTIAPSAVHSINQQLDLTGFPGPRLTTGIVPASFDTTNFLSRFDHRLTNKHQLSARFSLPHITADNSRTVGGLNAVSRGSGLSNTDLSGQLNLISNLSARTINEFRAQFTRSRLDAPINDPQGPSVTISGVANFGTATSSPLARDINLLEVVENVSTEKGNHSFKTGIDYLHNSVDILFPGAIQGAYSFSSLNNFLAGNYSGFQQAFGTVGQKQANRHRRIRSDEWRLRTNLTLNAGVRYDVQFLPAPVQTDWNNIAPRIGIAYAPGDHKTVLGESRAFYDQFL